MRRELSGLLTQPLRMISERSEKAHTNEERNVFVKAKTGMMMKPKLIDRTLILTSIACLLPVVLALFLYNRLPEQVAIHWGSDGEANGYANRAVAAFGLPAGLLAVNVLLHVVINHDPKYTNVSKAIMLVSKWCIPLIAVIICPVTLFIAIGIPIQVNIVVPAIVGILFILMGNYMPKCKLNYTVGIKLPWTLASEENWNRTHHLAGYVWVIGGIVFIISTFTGIGWLFWVVLAAMAAVPTIYSFILFRLSKKGEQS